MPRVGRLALLAIRSLPLLKYRLRGDPRSLVKERIAKIISVSRPEGVDVEENAALVLYGLRHRRGFNLRAHLQHQAAVAATRPRAAALATLSVPTLVVHGTDDALIPFEHARRLAASILAAAHERRRPPGPLRQQRRRPGLSREDRAFEPPVLRYFGTSVPSRAP